MEQFDIHSPQATILEALWFSARLRQPNEIDKNALSVFIQEVRELTDPDQHLCRRFAVCPSSYPWAPAVREGLSPRTAL